MQRYNIALAGICLFFAFTILTPIQLITTDIGRHLTNGRLLLSHPELLTTNFYSYTLPQFSFINHHWGFGVAAFEIFKLAGFSGLTFAYITLSLLSLIGVLYLSYNKSSSLLNLSLSLMLFPLWVLRTEIRPEVLTLFFSIIIWIILDQAKRKKSLKISSFLLVPLIFMAWINCHVLYPLGFVILGYHWLIWVLDIIIETKNLNKLFKSVLKNIFFSLEGKKWLLLFSLSILFLWINPIGTELVKAPYILSQNYGYKVIENQNLWFLFQRSLMFEYVFPWFIIFGYFCLLSLLFIHTLLTQNLTKKNKIFLSTLPHFVFLVFLGLLSFSAARSITYASILALPLLSKLSTLIIEYNRETSKIRNFFFYSILFLAVLGSQLSFWSLHQFYPLNLSGHYSLSYQQQSAEFFKNERLKGPIFNNYDIGGYLIFNLFPEEKVFVDNRPEAYSEDFFNKIYIPAQENNVDWEKLDNEYNFNVIYFFRQDMTPWAQEFLHHRIDDRVHWAPIYVDDYVIMFIKRLPNNLQIINKRELPAEMFSFKKN